MKRSALDLSVGIFVLIGLLALGWLSVKLGRVDFLGSRGYVISADFPSVGGLKAGSSIEIAGVEVGRVDKILLQDYQARVVMVSHEIPEIFEIADRVAMLHEGVIVEVGSPEAVRASTNPIVQQFIRGDIEMVPAGQRR